MSVQMQIDFAEQKVEKVKKHLNVRIGSQNYHVLEVFKSKIDYDFTPIEVWRFVVRKIKGIELTSVRRSINELTGAGYIVKNDKKKKKEIYGDKNNTWRLNDQKKAPVETEA